MHISLTGELEEVIKNKVASGLYNNASEVVRDALRQMLKHDDLEQRELEQLRKAIAIGIEQADRGELIDADIVFARLDEKAKKKLAQSQK